MSPCGPVGPGGPGGPVTGCPGCNGGNHTWGNLQNWQTTFTNNLQTASWVNNPGQPCQFLQTRINHWTSVQQGLNNCNAYWNQLECKIKHATVLMQQNNC